MLADELRQVALADAIAFADLDALELALLDVAGDRVRVELQPRRNLFDCEPIVVMGNGHRAQRLARRRTQKSLRIAYNNTRLSRTYIEVKGENEPFVAIGGRAPGADVVVRQFGSTV